MFRRLNTVPKISFASSSFFFRDTAAAAAAAAVAAALLAVGVVVVPGEVEVAVPVAVAAAAAVVAVAAVAVEGAMDGAAVVAEDIDGGGCDWGRDEGGLLMLGGGRGTQSFEYTHSAAWCLRH
ncbi:hypothetical protein PC116_g33009 [Phytophthora cactorum]|nr:hypothetical protein PC116_g33009 [Phytophthora cactorum]